MNGPIGDTHEPEPQFVLGRFSPIQQLLMAADLFKAVTASVSRQRCQPITSAGGQADQNPQ